MFIPWLNGKLQGWPNGALTVLLLVLAAFSVWVAFKGSPAHKAFIAAWLMVP